ncbi:glycosyltransferase family 2 protein [Hymenobacter nivis]|uniref:Glycosyltransferase n=1 Tax=Hymenobacter nivis TaxID=1850093 RepID=A0A502GD29_9BACT|nr:glycosyltransferase [Hymenobacter nivis]TPG58946.1 glycosyltransferase [Hymenobacter nivis]
MVALSIIVPVYNKEEYIDGTITSILAQSFTDFELLLIDDGSTDKSAQRCAYYAAMDNRIRVVSQANQGVSQARNTGLRLSEGTYIGFIDGDDLIEPDMYELLITNALATQADVSVCGMKVFHAGSVSEKAASHQVQVFNRNEALSAMLTGVLEWSANNKIYVAALAKSIAFEGRINEDLYYVFRVLSQANKVGFTNNPKYHYIKRDNSVSMAKFNAAQMESIAVSQRILAAIQQDSPAHLEEARALDFGAHLSILNMILLASKVKYDAYYQQVSRNLAAYADSVNQLKYVAPKQKYAFKLFMLNPLLYNFFLRSYCFWFSTEAGKKTR